MSGKMKWNRARHHGKQTEVWNAQPRDRADMLEKKQAPPPKSAKPPSFSQLAHKSHASEEARILHQVIMAVINAGHASDLYAFPDVLDYFGAQGSNEKRDGCLGEFP